VVDQVSGQQGGGTLGEYGGAFRRRWWVVVLGALIGLGLAAAYLLVAPKTFIATASVYVNPLGGVSDNAVDGARLNSGVNLDTEAQLVTSQAVSSRAKVILQTPEIVGQLVQNVEVAVPPNTNVLRISFTAPTAEEARDGAAAYAAAYLENRRNTANDLLDAQERALRQQIAELSASLRTATDEERPAIESSLETLNTRLAYIVGTPITPGKVISDSLLPRSPASPNTALVLASGLAFGLLLGLLGLFGLERRDGRCYDWRSVERRLGLAVLADIPGKAGSPAVLFEPHTPGAEAYGEVRNAVLSGLGTEPAVLVISSPSEGFGADAVTANLAVALARAGHSTTVLVADEASSIPDLFGLPATDGLSSVLRGRADVSAALQSLPDVPLLTVLPAGHGLQSDIDDLEGAGLADVLADLAERSHFVVVRPRPNDAAADAQFLARHARAAVPVIEVGRTVREAVAHAVRQWQLVGAAVPGAVTVPAYEAPEPAPPRAVTSGARDGAPTPRPALPDTKPTSGTPAPKPSAQQPTQQAQPTQPTRPFQGQPQPKNGAADQRGHHPQSPLRKAPPQR
jgi:polysaccharide biosynthesis transport protein